MTALVAFDGLMKRFEWVAYALLVFGLASFVWFAADRAPPFAITSVEPASARPGETITIRAAVRRDAHRNCSADFSRFIYDAGGGRFDLGTSFASAQMIAEMEREAPGRLTVRVVVPPGADVGPAALVTSLAYVCNRAHTWWPIEVTTRMPFTVLPS